MRFLQISDIHFWCCEEAEDQYRAMRDIFLSDMENVLSKIGSIDYILVCGDIANKGKKEEYEKARKFFETLQAKLKKDGKAPTILSVPGNHDVDRNANAYQMQAFRLAMLNADNGNNWLSGLRHEEPSAIKTLFSPLNNYNDFASTHILDGISERIKIGTEDYSDCNYYWSEEVGKLGNYHVRIYGINTVLTCDGNEASSNELTAGSHLLFVPLAGYNTGKQLGCINVSMMHHPTDWLINGEKVKKSLDSTFQVQFFGHIHKQNSDKQESIHVYSGALQPEGDGTDEDWPTTYNVVSLDVEDNTLKVSIKCRKWNGNGFDDYEKETKSYAIALGSTNKWGGEDGSGQEELTHSIPEIRYKFMTSDRPRHIIEEIAGTEFYDKKESEQSNCLRFMKYIRENNKWNVLSNKLYKL